MEIWEHEARRKIKTDFIRRASIEILATRAIHPSCTESVKQAYCKGAVELAVILFEALPEECKSPA